MILVTGKNGQLAFSFRKYLQDRAVYWGREEFGPLEEQSVLEKLRALKPSLIINTAAYTAVDKAETDLEEVRKLNIDLPRFLSQYAEQNKIPLIHFSTDYVYQGTGDVAWTENDPVEPGSAYGMTKLEGERVIQASKADALIFRTSWVYNYHGANFVKTILRLASEREQLRIVSDQVGSPTYSDDLAGVLCQNIDVIMQNAGKLKGIYNIAGQGYVSWFDFAKAIVEEARSLGWPLKVQEIIPITTEEYPTPARRPKNSRMSQEKLFENFKIQMPEWRSSLRVCLKALKDMT